MSDVSSGARAPDADPGVGVPNYPAADTYPATPATYPTTPDAYPTTSETYPTAPETYPTTTQTYSGSAGDESKARQVAGQTKEAAGQAAAEVKDTAKEQAQRVAGEAKYQARNVAADLRDKASERARTQNDKLVSSIRQTADHLDEMRADRADSPAATVVSRVAQGGRQLADYLDRNGPDGVLREVQDFARRRPGAFLATALAAGFVVGRLGKGVAKADPYPGTGDYPKPGSDAFVSSTPDAGYVEPPAQTPPVRTSAPQAGYTSSTEYASTGTGTPVVVDEEYVFESPERRP